MAKQEDAKPWCIATALHDGAIVSPCNEVIEFEILQPKERARVKQGDPVPIAIDIICEPIGLFKKRAIVPSPVKGGIAYEIMCDESASVGGTDAAPAPMVYFTAGVAFCLLTHITGYLRFVPLDIRKLKLEVRGNYMTKLGHIHSDGQGEGGCDSFETYVIIESDEPPDKIKDFVEMCERACIASQTVAQAVPTSVKVVLNGKAS